MVHLKDALAPTKAKIVVTIALLLLAWYAGLALLSLIYSSLHFSLPWILGILGYGILDLGFAIGILLDSFLLSIVLQALYLYALVSFIADFFSARFGRSTSAAEE